MTPDKVEEIVARITNEPATAQLLKDALTQYHQDLMSEVVEATRRETIQFIEKYETFEFASGDGYLTKLIELNNPIQHEEEDWVKRKIRLQEPLSGAQGVNGSKYGVHGRGVPYKLPK